MVEKRQLQRFETENESADARDSPVAAGCTAAQICANGRQIIGKCCPRTDWKISWCYRVMSKLVLTQPVGGELYAFGKEKPRASASSCANTRACASSTMHKRS